MARRPPAKTTDLDSLFPEDEGPSPDELVAFDETTASFAARTGQAEPKRLAATDAVPVFRGDLQIAKGASAGLFEVADPAGGRHFTLYEFELSVARMLDGRRHASDVIDNGVRLGIPVDLDGLNKFVRQLWRYGFLAEPGAAPVPADGEESGWGERVKWDEATRTLFQTGLRLMRQGRPQDAESYFHAVLDADPANAEATELLSAIARGETLPAVPIGRRARSGEPAAAVPRRAARIAISAAGVAAIGAAVGVAFLLQHRHPFPAPAPRAPAQVARPTPALRPAPAWRTAAVLRRERPRLAELSAPVAGTVAWSRKAGDRVAAGDRIGTLRKRGGRGARDVALAATAAGTLLLTVADRARVEPGAPLGAVVDGNVWIVDAFLDGEPIAPDAACELRGDAVAERSRCRVESRRPREGGSELTIRVEDAAASWAGAARSLRVRLAPAGTPLEP